MKSVDIYIDDEALDVDNATSITVNHEIANIEQPDKSLTGNAQNIEIPYTERNRKIMRFSEQILSEDLFNNTSHTAKVYENGNLVMSGNALIDKSVDNGNNFGHYAIKILGASADWVKGASNSLIKDLADDFSVKYYLADVYANSILEEPTLIKFFPVDRGIFYKQNAEGDYIDRTNIELADYHPFINIWLLLSLILKGYTIKSSMEPLFKKLYMTGCAQEQDDIDGIEADNDFKAGSNFDIDSVAAIFSTEHNEIVINLFNQWGQDEYGDNDNDLHVATDGILEVIDGITKFIPTASCTVAFKISVTFDTTVNAQGAFVDTLKFGVGEDTQELHLTPDMSDEYDADNDGTLPEVSEYTRAFWWVKLKNPSEYTAIVMDEEFIWYPREGLGFEIWKERTVLTNDIKQNGQWIYVESHTTSSEQVNGEYGSLNGYWLYAINSSGKEVRIGLEMIESSKVVYMKKYKLSFIDIEFNTYSYNIGERQQFPMAVTFGVSSMNGVDVKLWLGEGCEITPNFRNSFAYGSDIGLSVAGGDKTQIQFIQALRHLFNLYFYTNPITKEVFIEPRSEFYTPISVDSTAVVDWSHLIDDSHEVEIEQVGNNIGDSIKLAYADGNDVVKTYNRRNKCMLGTFESSLENKTTNGVKELTNPMFAPFVERTVESMGWSVLQNVLETNKSTVVDVEYDLTPAIGIFNGIKERIGGSDNEVYPKYPSLVFRGDFFSDYNLGFEDVIHQNQIFDITGKPISSMSKKVKGLHQYYDCNIKQYNRARRITAYMRLSSIDVENIQCPSNIYADFRSVFVLVHKGERIYCELEKIIDYNPSSDGSTKCSFITKVED